MLHDNRNYWLSLNYRIDQGFFIVFFSEAIYQAIGTPKDQLSPGTVTTVNLGSGVIAGTCAAIISQPADTLLSKINKQKGAEGQSVTSRLVTMAGQLGVKGLFTGLGPRIVMVATLTAGQFAIYGDIKRVLGKLFRNECYDNDAQNNANTLSRCHWWC